MTHLQHLLGKVAEECMELGQRALKAQQFTLEEIQTGQDLDNLERLRLEARDLQAQLKELEAFLSKPGALTCFSGKELWEKRKKFREFTKLAVDLGQVDKFFGTDLEGPVMTDDGSGYDDTIPGH